WGAAKRGEAGRGCVAAAASSQGGDFYFPAGDVRNGLYDDFARNWALGMKGVAGYERIAIPYPGGHLPGFRLQAKGKERSTFFFTGGADSVVEKIYNFLFLLSTLWIKGLSFLSPRAGADPAATT